MNTSRRKFVSLGVPFVLFAGVASAQKGNLRGRLPDLTDGESRMKTPKPGDDPAQPDPHAMLVARREAIGKEVQRLSELVGELKQDFDETDASALLSVPFIKKTDQIQKVAKHIHMLARG